ncbi:MAG: hypothetical protein GWO04_40120 [Actinobacteria bacterium]|nr:hypothetical protein [Actinomycetota bacterium]
MASFVVRADAVSADSLAAAIGELEDQRAESAEAMAARVAVYRRRLTAASEQLKAALA